MKNFMRFSGIRAKTTLYILASVIITVIIIGAVLFVALFNSQQNFAKSDFQNIASRHAAGFERTISNALDYLTSVTSVLEFQISEGEADREALQRVIYYIFDGHTVDSSSIYFEPNVYDNRDADYKGTMYGTALSGRISYYFFRFNGRTGYRPAAMENEIEFSLPIYTETKKRRAPVYTAPGIYSIDGVETLKFTIGYPIFSNNHFLGVVTADIFLEDLYRELQSEEIFETGYMIIANDKGQVVYSPRFEDIGKTREDIGLLYSLPSDDFFGEVFNATSILTGERTLVAGQSIYFPQLDSRFYLSVAAPLSEINAQGSRLLIIVIAFSITLTILIAVFLYHLIGRMTKPLIEFTKTSDEIARGDYSARIIGSYEYEFDTLKDSMNLMTERVQKSFNTLRNMLNGIDAFVYVTDPATGKILFVNEQMKLGYNINDDIIGQYCYRVFQEGKDDICDFCPCHILNKDPETSVVWENFCTITQRYYHNTDVYIDWVDNNKVHLCHLVDITDLKTATEEKIKAEELSKTKSAFLANMSHEIRTPMNSIIGFSELALDDSISQKTRDYLTNILENSGWLLNIINDILDISKIEAGKLETENIPFNLQELFTVCRSMIIPKANEKGLKLLFYAEPSIGKTPLGDPTRLRQVLVNLLSNAVKFTSSGIIKLLSTVDNITDKTVTMHFEVKDSGIGMTAEQIKRAIDPFMQAESGTTRKYGGTGLGLAITKHLVEAMGGNLDIESTPGVGSKFSFTLTFDTINAADDDLSKTKIVLNELKKPTFEGDILVCEDNAMNQQIICEYLEKVGINATVADNGLIGLEMVRDRMQSGKKQFDLIFMDMHMPEMDGLETTEKIMELNTGVPIVAMTANIMSHDRDLYKSSGMVDYVGKPFTSQELWQCLLKFFTPVSWKSEDETRYVQAEEVFQRKLMKNFISKNSEKAKEIEDAIASGDIKLAHRLAHTLKANAGQLKRYNLQQVAEDVENHLKDGKNHVTTRQIKNLKKELKAVLEEISIVIQEDAEHNEKPPELDKKAALELLDKIQLLLEDSDSECLSYTDELKAIPESDDLIKCIDDFDYSEALELLALIKKNY